jgi:hypothetical protein
VLVRPDEIIDFHDKGQGVTYTVPAPAPHMQTENPRVMLGVTDLQEFSPTNGA